MRLIIGDTFFFLTAINSDVGENDFNKCNHQVKKKLLCNNIINVYTSICLAFTVRRAPCSPVPCKTVYSLGRRYAQFSSFV